MILDLVVELAWKSSLCAALTLLLLALLKRRSAAERSRVAHAGLLAILLLPLSLLLVPEMEVQAPPSVSRALTLPAPAPIVSTKAPHAAGSAVASTAATDDVPASLNLPLSVEAMLFGIPPLLLLAMTLLAVLRLQLIRSRSEVVADPAWLIALARMQQRFGFKHGTALLMNAELSSPISWGVLRPVILLSPGVAEDRKQADAIIAHELAHVARKDWVKLLIGRAATAIFWFNPLVWLLAAECHHLREEAADDAVLRTDFESIDYAELLVGVARHENRALHLACNGVAPSRSSLSRRVSRVLDRSRSRRPARFGWTAACLTGAVLVGAPLAALSPVSEATGRPTAARPEIPAITTLGSPPRPAAAVARPEVTALAMQPDLPTPAAAPQPLRTPAADTRDSYILPMLEEALVKAAERGDRIMVEGLLASGVSVNAAVAGDGTPLIGAARSGRRDLVEYLLARGADINQPLDGDGNPLIVAAAEGHREIVRLLLDRGADIEWIVPSDENALMQASYWGREDVVRLLIERGANVNSRDGSRTPLNMARARGHGDIERMLASAGAIR